ncbi:signal transduction histidine kinase [Tenacibaculum adriaticum]|uniref:histidine kinase n=1 Tax=Tenacibaculum adriaticum TaxID=413713 RepID=A0A5S5DYN5_9FLAO|nr:HAMP domain-containing sensor histidine kinase [Tenacibaculum adriaticum]TYP99882.1 signal transduction histidine kinase [Tenacibaculum adriaticum]
MKLLRFTNQYYFIGLLIASLVGSVLAFYITKYNINEGFNQKLYAEKEQLIHELNEFDELLSTYTLNIGDKINIKKVDEDPRIETFIKDTVMYSTYEKNNLNHRQILFSEKIKENYYIISITKSLLSQENLIKDVLEIIFVIIILLFLTMVLLANIVSKIVWKPFYDTLFQLRSYNIKKSESLKLLPTKVLEFNELNTTIENMTFQVEKDYKLLREYTENVSHEIQTPLAIIKNKIELLLQDQTLNEEHLITLAQLHQSTGRLSRLSKNLSILTKIENNQFVENTEIYLADYIKERIEDFEELLILKDIELTTKFKDNPKLLLNETLAYLLFNNLISNAIKHNIKGGGIAIEITDKSFVITNTGKPLIVSKVELFNRFVKSTNSSESTGLGLSMVKKIISFYNFYIAYKNEDNLHVITVLFIKKNILNTKNIF